MGLLYFALNQVATVDISGVKISEQERDRSAALNVNDGNNRTTASPMPDPCVAPFCREAVHDNFFMQPLQEDHMTFLWDFTKMTMLR